MRWRRLPPAMGAVLALGLLWAGPAAAQPDHLHVDLSLVACGTLQATGYHLPEDAPLRVGFVNAASGRTLAERTARTDADGALALQAKVPLTGVRTVRMTVARPGAAKPFAFSELTVAGNCPLPFTGPARLPALTGLATVLLGGGLLLVRASGSRGRHRARRRRVGATG
jgi:hypothetical protein